MDMLRRFDDKTFARGLEDWAWLLAGKPLRPLAASMFGDVFLQGPDGVWFLDSLEGPLAKEWPDARTLESALRTPEGEDQYLLGGIVAAAYEPGLEPGPEQIFMFSVHPALGGAISAENVEVMDYVVASSICGQLREQINGMPPGTRITGVTFTD
ncbi:MAG: hypothetical protein KBF43_00270 [Dermatophilaceae bacterium]|nr:hypothetical protein [Dermatophilaceae bacterium]MBP9917006.1 hypothetical protein [Dermatophilaceae bacterium]